MRDRQAVYRFRELGHGGCMGLSKVGIQAHIQGVFDHGSVTYVDSDK